MMTAKEWFEQSEYQYALDEHDEGGYLGINENKVAQMLEEYHQSKVKTLGLFSVVGRSELLKFLNWYVKDEALRSETDRLTNIVDRYLKEF